MMLPGCAAAAAAAAFPAGGSGTGNGNCNGNDVMFFLCVSSMFLDVGVGCYVTMHCAYVL